MGLAVFGMPGVPALQAARAHPQAIMAAGHSAVLSRACLGPFRSEKHVVLIVSS